MSTRQLLRLAAPLLAAATLLAGCQAASGGAPTSSPKASAPASFADWTARQGFGGSVGLREINHGAHWLQENTGADDYSHWIFWWNGMVQDLAAWLDTHDPTACWADYHAQVRAGLASSLKDLAAIQAAADAHLAQPYDAITDFVTKTDALMALPDPSGCS
jgi:hypothetical protein